MRLLLIGLALSILQYSDRLSIAAEVTKRPNIVLIMADNQGAWTLGCYGNADIRTPHIDRLAAEGMRFTRAFSSNPVCSPTRATFLTGLLPSQHGVHCFLRADEWQMGEGAKCVIDEFRTLPEILADAGYVCGLVGKWHLGANASPHRGFRYWVTMPHGGTQTFYNAAVVEDGQQRREPKYLTDFWTQRAIEFIDQQQNDERPFFLLLPYNGPYNLSRFLLRPAQNRHADYYADKQLLSFPRGPMHPWQHANKEYLNNPVSIRRVAAETSGVDDGVGALMASLKQNGLDDNTLVIYCADQGWVGGQNGLWGMGDHTQPVTAFDGMMQIPLIFRHPSNIPAATISDLMTSNYDLMPTLLSYLGLADQMPDQPRSPGRDYSAALRGQTLQQWDNTVYYEMETLRCIRTSQWKYVHRHPSGPHELYHLVSDPHEKTNRYGQPLDLEVQGLLKAQLDQFFIEHADPNWDIYRGGGSKVKRFTSDDTPTSAAGVTR
jgi:arylsulfatase A-like enzyme